MIHLLTICFPLFGSILLALLAHLPERYLKPFVRAWGLISGLLATASAFEWSQSQNIISLFSHNFYFDLNYDLTAMVFSLLTAFCGSVIVHFSSFYMHREEGFGRFFSLIFLLIGGMQILSMADNLFTFFIGWEFLGIASFFLISFYRRRVETVRNALKVFVIYRIGDLGLMSGMILMHLNMVTDLRFSALPGYSGLEQLLPIAIVGVIIAAAAKSAQLPFSYWLPKAMEGPTPSSAIFYGALSVHAGALLLIRMNPLWEHLYWSRLLIGGIGFASMICGSLSARIQTSIKGRLAMASVAQVGIIFIEIGLGYLTLALYHTAAHALFRSLQLIISPSIVAYFFDSGSKIHGRIAKYIDQFKERNPVPSRLRVSIYALILQDYYLDLSENLSLKSLVHGFSSRKGIIFALLALTSFYFTFGVSYACGFGAFYLSLFALSQTNFKGFLCILFSEVLVTTLVFQNVYHYFFYFLPWVFLLYLCPKKNDASFTGLFISDPFLSTILFFLGALSIGVPPSAGFLLGDILLEEIFKSSYLLAFFVGVCHSVNGYVVFRNLALITMGPEPLPSRISSSLLIDKKTKPLLMNTLLERLQ